MSLNAKDHTLPTLSDELLQMIGALALNLHESRSEDLGCELPAEQLGAPLQISTSDFIVDGNTIRFSSIEDRNRYVAAYVFEKNRHANALVPKMWLSVAHDLWRMEIGKADSAAGRLLAFVNQSGDLFSIAAEAIESGSMQVFTALHVVTAAIPYLERLSVEGIFKLSAAQHEGTKNDFFSGLLFTSLGNALDKFPDTCRAIHNHLRSDTSELTANLHPTALLALAKSSPEEVVGLALEDAESPNASLKGVALWTLGRLIILSLVPTESIPLVLGMIIANLSSPMEQVRRTAIKVAADATPVVDSFYEPLTKLGKSGDQDVLTAIAFVLMLNTTEMKTKTFFEEWLRLLCKLSPQVKGVIDHYDCVLHSLLSDDLHQQLVISCLTEWSIVNVKNRVQDRSVAELFDSTTFGLSNRPELLSRMVTDWFLADNWQLPSAAAGLLSHLWVHGFKTPEFNTHRLDDLKKNDLIFLARRLLGFIHFEDHLISLTMSFLKTKDAPERTFGIVHSLLVDELGRDYPVTTTEILKSTKGVAMDDDLIAFYSTMIEEIEGRMKAIEELPRLTELNPSTSLQRQFALARARQMNDKMEEAQKTSVIRQLATEIPIKAGHSWFSYRDGSYTGTSHLQSFSHSISIPRRHVLDSVGYDSSRFMLRLTKREESCD